jgi:hypothetical protein
MSMEHPNILYVGDVERGRALRATVESLGWYVYQPADVMEALAMYIQYMPDITVIEASPRYTTAFEAHYHLGSVGARPVLVLADETQPEAWIRLNPATRVLPYDLTREALVAAINDIIPNVSTQFS